MGWHHFQTICSIDINHHFKWELRNNDGQCLLWLSIRMMNIFSVLTLTCELEFSQPFFLGLTPPRRLRKRGWFPILSNSLTWCYRVWKLDVWWSLIYEGFLEEISFTKSSYHPCNMTILFFLALVLILVY